MTLISGATQVVNSVTYTVQNCINNGKGSVQCNGSGTRPYPNYIYKITTNNTTITGFIAGDLIDLTGMTINSASVLNSCSDLQQSVSSSGITIAGLNGFELIKNGVNPLIDCTDILYTAPA